ncbi:transposase (plasmid) [Mycobacterium sp. TJFP1]
MRSEAAFVTQAGVNPFVASSGNAIRHRLNCGGDRRLNRGLHMCRHHHDPRPGHPGSSSNGAARRGRATKEIRHCFHRCLTRISIEPYGRLHAQPRALSAGRLTDM